MVTSRHGARALRRSRGFTLVEILISTAVGAAVVAAAFAMASTQVQALNDSRKTGEMHATGRVVFDIIAEDIRNAGFGTSFFAGVDEVGAFDGRAVVRDAANNPLGVPAIRIVDGAVGPVGAADGSGVRIGSDAIAVLRPEGQATNLPASAPGTLSVAAAPGIAPIAVQDAARLTPCLAANGGSGLVLVSDMMRQGTPTSLLFELGAVNPVTNEINFVDAGPYGIAATGARAGQGVSPNGAGPGSIVVCVRMVTYWVDNIGRLRVWRSRSNQVPFSGGAIVGAAPAGASLPMNGATDPVLAEGVETMQIALRMSGQSPVSPNGFTFGNGDPPIVVERQIVETRGVRISALVRTQTPDTTRAPGLPANIENWPVPAGLPRTYHYRLVQFQAELRNMRLFDLASNAGLTWNQIRSFQP